MSQRIIVFPICRENLEDRSAKLGTAFVLDLTRDDEILQRALAVEAAVARPQAHAPKAFHVCSALSAFARLHSSFLQGAGKDKFGKGKGKAQSSAPKAYHVCNNRPAYAFAFWSLLQGKEKGKTDQLKRKATHDPYGGSLVNKKVNGCFCTSFRVSWAPSRVATGSLLQLW